MPRWLRGVLMEDQFKLFVAVLCMISGIPLTIRAVAAPNSLVVVLSPLGIRLWGGSLGLGGTLVIAGILLRHIKARRRYIEGLMIEAAGLIPLGLAALVVAVLAIYVVGTQALFGASVYLMFTFACAARFWATQQIVKQVRLAIQLEEDGRREHQ